MLRALALSVALLAFAAVPAHAAETVVEDGYLTVSDGTQLRFHLERPAGDARLPVLLQYDGYSAGTGPDFGAIPKLKERLLQRGYAFLGVSIRGTGCSGGTFDLFEPRQARDGYDIVEWAARQSWSNGDVGMLGYSFPGIMQLFTGAQRPPHLRAIAPSSVVFDLYRDVAYPGGIFNRAFAGLFTEQQKLPGQQSTPQAVAGGDAQCGANYANGQATGPVIYDQGARSPFLDSPLDYAARSPQTTADRIQVPALTVVYWQDEQTGPRVGGLVERGGLLRRLDDGRTWALLSNGNHDFTLDNPAYLDALERFFEHYLRGADNGWPRTPHVQVLHDVRRSTERAGWTTGYDRLPSPDPVALTLLPDGRLGDAAPPADGGASSYDYPEASPSTNPLPYDHGELDAGFGQPVPENGRLVFTTPALARDAVTFGSASADLWFASTATDTDLQATITEVRPDGRELYVQRGWLRASHRALDPRRSTPARPLHTDLAADAKALTPGEPALLRLEVMPFSHTFRRGSAIRLVVDAPTGITGNWGFDFLTTRATNTVLHDAAHPSRLVLGLLRGERAGAEAPPCDDLLNMACRDSIAPVPAGSLDLGDAAREQAAASGRPRPCTRTRRVRLTLPRAIRRRPVVKVAGKRMKIQRRRGRFVALLRLAPRRSGVAKVTISGRGRHGRRVRETRRFRICTGRR